MLKKTVFLKRASHYLLFGVLCMDLFGVKPWKTVYLESNSQKSNITVNVAISNLEQPTFIFLPGIFRGASPGKEDVFLEQLSKKRHNWCPWILAHSRRVLLSLKKTL